MTIQFITERRYLKAVTPKTEEWYKQSFKAFEGALDSKATINQRIMELRQRGVRPVSINTWVRAVNAYFMWLHTEHGRDPLKIPRLKEEEKILLTLPLASVEKIVRHKAKGVNATRAQMLALTILDTGLRATEALSLREGDCDLDNMTLKVKGKGEKHRLVPLSVELRKRLWRSMRGLQEGNRYVFGTKYNTQVTVRNLERDFRMLGAQIGIGHFAPHQLRHTFAVNYLRLGGNLEFLRRILGHSSLLTTQRYLRSLGVEDLQKVHDGLSLLSR